MSEIIKSSRQKFDSLNRIALFVFTAIILAWGKDFVPPAPGLDPGWVEALVQATDQGLSFGKEVVFTFGPYHQLYTNAIGDNLYPLVIGRLIYGMAWGAAAVGLANLSSPAFGWLIAIFLAFTTSLSADAPFYALQIVFLFVAASVARQKKLLVLAAIYCGIIVGIFCKLSFAVSAGPVIICVAILLARYSLRTARRRFVAMVVAVIVPVILWLASGQVLSGVFGYLLGPNLAIVLGYSSAMATDDASAGWQVFAYWTGSIALVTIIYRASCFRIQNRIDSLMVTSISLFLFWTMFKAGMVRHDGHAFAAGQSLASFAIITLAYASQQIADQFILFPALSALTLGLSIASQYSSPIRSSLDHWFVSQVKNTYVFAETMASHGTSQRLQARRQKGFEGIKSDVENLSLIPGGGKC